MILRMSRFYGYISKGVDETLVPIGYNMLCDMVEAYTLFNSMIILISSQ